MDRTAVVTGAASGIGAGVASRLLAEGWTVHGMDLSIDRLKAAAEHFKRGRERYHCVACDVASPASTASAFGEVSRTTERLDALICSAGAIRIGALEENTPDEVDLMLGVNVKGPWLCVRSALPLLRSGATQSEPHRVVIIGSVSGLRPKIGSGMYAASKAAVHVLAGVMAVELAASGITVNAVAPGTTDTPMIVAMSQMKSSVPFKLSGRSPLGRLAQPDDIAGVVSFLLGKEASYINGAVIPVDGGTRAAHVG